MSSTDDQNSGRRPVADERGNPFVTFRRFADDQISSLYRGLVDLPSSFPLMKRHRDGDDFFADQQRRWSQEAAEFEKILNDFFSQAHEEPHPPRDEQRYGTNYGGQNFRDQPKETQQHLSRERAEAKRITSCVRGAENEEQQQQQQQQQPLSCPYRPSEEESHQMRSQMCDMLPPGQIQILFPGIWQHCQDRLKSKPAKEALASQPQHVEEEAALAEDEFTESDMYEHFLRAQLPLPPSSSSNSTEHNPTPPTPPTATSITPQPSYSTATSQDIPSIISTLTTTERNTLPDGSVTTKVVLKKRFSDGSEESSESIHTAHMVPHHQRGQQQQQQLQQERIHEDMPLKQKMGPAVGHDGRVRRVVEEEIREKKKGGWFWS
ncbi:MAG: hypothetical protein Q9190_003464 [Brigantiaea leucoxantha]